MAGQPARRGDHGLGAQLHRVTPAVADKVGPQHVELPPHAFHGGADGTVGGHRPPCHPAPGFQKRRQGRRRPLDATIGGQRQDLGTRLHDESPVGVGGTAMQARHRSRFHCRQRAGGQVDGLQRRKREARHHGRTQHRLVDEDHQLGLGDPGLHVVHHCLGPLPHRRPGHLERQSGLHPGGVQRHAQGHRPGGRHLDGTASFTHCGDKRPQAHKGVTRKTRVPQGRLGVERSIVDHQRAVVGDRDASHPVGGLGDHAFASGSPRQRRGRRKPRLLGQHEVDCLPGVDVRQASNGRGHAHGQAHSLRRRPGRQGHNPAFWCMSTQVD